MNLARTGAVAIGAGLVLTGAIVVLVIPAARGPEAAKAYQGVNIAPAPAARPPQPQSPAKPVRGAKAPPSAYLTVLRRFAAEKNWTELSVLAFNEAEKISPDDRISTLDLLVEYQESGDFPALFCIARHYWFGGDKEEACRWFLKASVVYSIDAQRCTDPTSRQAVQGVQMHFGPLTEHLKQVDARTKRRWTQEALDFEEGISDRKPARWIAAHGLAAFKTGKAASGGQGGFLPDDQWPAARERARASIAASLEK